MLYIIIGLGLFFILTGLILTENNARYLLAGYNSLPDADRKRINIKSYISFFRRFHFFLGISFLALGICLYYLAGKNASGIFLAIYPLLGYVWFAWKGRHFNDEASSTKAASNFALVVLVVSLLLVSTLMFWGFKKDRMHVTNGCVKIEGVYGEVLDFGEISRVELVSELPDIRYKSNGFALGNSAKGYFKTDDGEKVKLILNTRDTPAILLTTKKGAQIFYSDKKAETTLQLFRQLRSQLKID